LRFDNPVDFVWNAWQGKLKAGLVFLHLQCAGFKANTPEKP